MDQTAGTEVQGVRQNRTVVRHMAYWITAGAGGLFSYLFFQRCSYERRIGNGKEEGKRFLRESIPDEKNKIMALAISLAAAFLLTRLFFAYGYLPTKALKYLLLIGGLIPIAWEDWLEKTIPNRWLVRLLCVRAVLIGIEAVLYPAAFTDNLIFTGIGGAVSGLVMFAGYVVSRHQIGAGDVKLLAVIGMYLGAALNYWVMVAALVIAAVYGGARVFLKRSGMRDEIAFAPFIAAGVILLLALGF